MYYLFAEVTWFDNFLTIFWIHYKVWIKCPNMLSCHSDEKRLLWAIEIFVKQDLLCGDTLLFQCLHSGRELSGMQMKKDGVVWNSDELWQDKVNLSDLTSASFFTAEKRARSLVLWDEVWWKQEQPTYHVTWNKPADWCCQLARKHGRVMAIVPLAGYCSQCQYQVIQRYYFIPYQSAEYKRDSFSPADKLNLIQ